MRSGNYLIPNMILHMPKIVGTRKVMRAIKNGNQCLRLKVYTETGHKARTMIRYRGGKHWTLIGYYMGNSQVSVHI